MRPPRESDFTSHLRSPALAARVGLWLGTCVAVAFLTGLLSYVARSHAGWLPPFPAWGYRVNQGLHVAAGTAAVPLLLVKLWVVLPNLFRSLPPLRRLPLEAAERAGVAVLVSSMVFLTATGLANVTGWYPWGFSFRGAHGAIAWWAAGGLLVHIAVQLPVIRAALAAPIDDTDLDRPATAARPGALDRRGLLRSSLVAAGLLTVVTAAEPVPGLRRLAVLAPRSGDGPQGVPVNRSAHAAGITTAVAEGYRLEVVGPRRTVRLSAAELAALPQHEAPLPIACVEGWSASATWSGVRVRDLLRMVGAADDRSVRVTSLERQGPQRVSMLPAAYAQHPDTLLATRLHGEPLSLDHGAPCRLIAPNRPGVYQTKWVARLEVV